MGRFREASVRLFLVHDNQRGDDGAGTNRVNWGDPLHRCRALPCAELGVWAVPAVRGVIARSENGSLFSQLAGCGGTGPSGRECGGIVCVSRRVSTYRPAQHLLSVAPPQALLPTPNA